MAVFGTGINDRVEDFFGCVVRQNPATLPDSGREKVKFLSFLGVQKIKLKKLKKLSFLV
eukprot:COSAG01_NODE_2518_length_7524_cov_2.305724_1_plen_58_part_10